MTRISVAAMAASALLLSACATQPARQTPVLVQTPPRVVVVADPQLTDLLAYQSALRLMTPSELAKAQADLAKAEHAPQNTIRRAMLHAAVRGTGDLARAQALLEPLLTATGKDAQLLAPLAQLLSSQYAELRRQEDSIDKLNAQLRDAQRRIDLLNEKLEALKNIERSLSVRPAAGAPK
ncbi:hypothetical protein [Janthinobacterium sp. AD80]|uniref:hypothetical protein n=1 Tax=Janthinobacterium sp. AD80 TaxID=1528773 RepID=UPI0021551433|nr:hypothetical protein [Janthinobacterium sp. AD80]